MGYPSTGGSGSGTSLTEAQEDVLEAFTADSNMKQLITDYTMQVGTNSVALGDQHTLSAGGTEAALKISDTKSFLIAQEIAEGSSPQQFTFSAEATKYLNDGYSTAIASVSDLTFLNNGGVWSESYTVGATEAITSILVRPSETGYLRYKLYLGTDSTGIVIYDKTVEITDDDVGEEVSLDAAFFLNEDATLFSEVYNVSPLGEDGSMYLGVKYLEASLSDIGGSSSVTTGTDIGDVPIIDMYGINSSGIGGNYMQTVTDFNDATEPGYWYSGLGSADNAPDDADDSDICICHVTVDSEYAVQRFEIISMDTSDYSVTKYKTAKRVGYYAGNFPMSYVWPNLSSWVDSDTETDSSSSSSIDAPTSDYSLLQGSSDGSYSWTTSPTLGGDLTVNGALDVADTASFGSTLSVTGATTLSNTLSVSGISTLTGNTTVGGTMGVTGAANLASTLDVTGSVTFGSTLTLSDTLTVSEDVVISGNYGIQYGKNYNYMWFDGTDLAIGTDDNLDFYHIDTDGTIGSAWNHMYLGSDAGYLTVNNTSANTSYNLYVDGTSDFTDSVSMESTLDVTSSITTESMIYVGTDATSAMGIEIGSTTTSTTPHIDFHSDGADTDYNVRLLATGGTEGTLGDGTLIIYADDITTESDLTVNNAATIGETLGVTGATTLSSTLDVEGTLTANGSISFPSMGDATPFGSQSSTAVGIDLGSLTTATYAYIDFHSSGTSNDYDSRIICSGGSSLEFDSDALKMMGAVTISSTLSATGATTLSSTLSVSDDTTLASDLTLSDTSGGTIYMYDSAGVKWGLTVSTSGELTATAA